MDWTDERIELLRQLAQEGQTSRQIAERLGGVSRNAVIGKLNRLDRETKAPTKPKPVIAKVVHVREPAPPPVPKPRIAERAPVVVAPTPPIQCEEVRGGATFLTLEAHMCRWPIGDPCGDDFTFCGQNANGRTYCNQHARQAYRPQSTSRDAARQLRPVLVG